MMKNTEELVKEGHCGKAGDTDVALDMNDA